MFIFHRQKIEVRPSLFRLSFPEFSRFLWTVFCNRFRRLQPFTNAQQNGNPSHTPPESARLLRKKRQISALFAACWLRWCAVIPTVFNIFLYRFLQVFKECLSSLKLPKTLHSVQQGLCNVSYKVEKYNKIPGGENVVVCLFPTATWEALPPPPPPPPTLSSHTHTHTHTQTPYCITINSQDF